MFAISARLKDERIWEEGFSTEDEADQRITELFVWAEAEKAYVYELSDDNVWESISCRWVVSVA